MSIHWLVEHWYIPFGIGFFGTGFAVLIMIAVFHR
jgi:hypothetical protein